MAEFLSVLLDPSQARLSQDLLSTLVSGRDWDPTYSANCWIDPVTNTLMLEPAPVNASWTTTNTGIFAKYTLSDFGLSSPWVLQSADPSGSTAGDFMYLSSNPSGAGGTGPTVGVNQPICFEYFPQKGTAGSFEIARFGWSNTGDSTNGVAVRWYNDGSAEVWKGGYLVGSYSGGGGSPNYFDQMLAQSRLLGGGASPQVPSGYIKVMMIPCRDRELLVVSSAGASFCHVFQDLPEGTANLTITPAETLWFYVPSPVQANVRIAKIQFQSSGVAYGYPSNWRFTPPSGTPTFVVFEALSDVSGNAVASVVTPATNPYGLANPEQICLTLTGAAGPNWTPFVYGAQAYFPSETNNTAEPVGGALDLLPYVMGFTLDVSDTIAGTRATVKLKQPAAIAAAGGTAITTMCHRAIQIFDENTMLINGISDPPHYTDSYGFDPASYDINQEIEIEVRDLWKLAEEYIFSDPIPLDGLSLIEAYTLVAETVGIPTSLVYVSPSASGFILPFTPVSGGDWAFLCDVGDKAAEILDKLHQTYASTWFHGFRPNPTPDSPPRLCLIDPADTSDSGLPVAAAVELYESSAAAVSGGVSDANIWKTLYRSYKTQILEPESNDIWVTGRDPRGGKPIVAHKADTASQAVTTAVASRPANWLGFIRKYAWVDPSITTISVAEFVVGLLFPKLTAARTMVEFEAEYQPGVWRGDLVTLHRATGDPVTVRIKTFSGTYDNVGGTSTDPNGVWRPCKYVGEVGPLVAPLDVHGTSLLAIASNWNMLKALSKFRVFDNGEVMARRPVLNQQEV